MLRLTLWSCEENCGYECMRENHALRLARGEQVVKYYGKWPFVRVLGTQELFSSLFSVANAIPHAQYYVLLRTLAPDASPLKTLWRVSAAINVHTWFWSAVFHARDCTLTERLDYFCASMAIAFGVFIALQRALGIRGGVARWASLATVGALYAAHVSYMQWVRFDYGWNMKVSISAMGVYTLLWIIWAARARRAPHRWKLLAGLGCLWASASLEVFDFAPFWDLVDAHAVWHGLTVPLAYLHYSFVADDCRAQAATEGEALDKSV